MKEMGRVMERQEQQICLLKRAADRFSLEEEVMGLRYTSLYRVRSMKEHLSGDQGTNISYWANINLFALVNLVCLWGIKKIRIIFEKFRMKLILNQFYSELTKHSVEI